MVNEASKPAKGVCSAALSSFREALRGLLIVDVDERESKPFEGAARWSAGRGFVLITLEMSPACLLSTGACAANAAVIALVRAGVGRIRIDETSHRLSTGSAIFLDLREPFELGFIKPVTLTMLASAHASISERFAADGQWHGLALDGVGASVFGSAQEAFAREIGRATAGEAEALASGLLDLATRAASMKLGDPGVTETLTQVRRFIDRNLGSTKLDTAMIGRAFGISQATLYRLFAPLGGVATYIRKARLVRARRIVLSPQMADRRIAEIAHEVGFRSATVFNRLFLASFGMTPSEARAESLRNLAEPNLFASGGDGDLAAKLRNLV